LIQTVSDLFRRLLPARVRPIGYLTHLVRTRTGGVVRQGPFAGMRYVDDSVGSAYLPKLLGMYERELTPCIEEMCSGHYRHIVDVGAAEGYYAVGVAFRNSGCRVTAFEMQAEGQCRLGEMARLNVVDDRIDIRGKCEPADLAATLASGERTAVICDVEGYEQILLDPIAVPALRHATILVEAHEFIAPGVVELLTRRFDDSHRIEHIWQQPRSGEEFPWRTLPARILPASYLDWAVSEWRPERMSWLWMQPLPPGNLRNA
jgi:hypothetical protein